MTASSSSSWTNTAGGLWDGANWSNGVPTSSTAATISGTSTFTVTVEAGLAAAAAALVINDANATVNDLGSLALGTGLTLTAGTFALGAGGVLSGGTVTLGTGGHLLNQGGTLSGLTYDGTLDLSQAAAAVTLSGVTLAGATGGTSSGTINLTGAGADLFELGTGTLNTALLNFGNATTAVTLSALDVGGAGVLTLGSKLSATLTTGSALIADAGGAGDGIINAGTLAIAATAKTSAVNIQGNSFKNTGLFTVSGGTVHLTDNSFVNTGTLSVSGGTGKGALTGTISIGGTGTAITTVGTSATGSSALNSGTILISAGVAVIDSTLFSNTGSIGITGGTLEFGGNVVSQTKTQQDSWSNSGTITESKGTLLLNGSFTTAGLGNFTHTGGTAEILGTDNNVGNTLNVGAGTSLGTLTFGNYKIYYGGPTGTTEYFNTYGYILGGTIHDAGGGMLMNYGTLDGVTYQGTLQVTTGGTDLSINDGITLQNLAGTGPGAMLIGNASANTYVALYGSTTLNNATITMGSNSKTSTSHGTVTVTPYFAALYTSDTNNTAATLTLGSTLVINETATAHEVDIFADDKYTSDAIINNGQIIGATATGDLSVIANQLTNNGLFAVSNGGTFEADSYFQLINNGTITSSNGTLEINTNATGPNPPSVSGTPTTPVLNSFTNDGTIITTGGQLWLCGTLTNGWQNGVNATGGQTYVQIYGYAEDAGTTLTIGAGTTGVTNQLVIGGTIIGGVVADTGNGLVAAGGTLDGVTYEGNFDPIQHAASSVGTDGTPNYPGLNEHYIDIKDSVVFTGSNGTGPGTVTLTNGVSLWGQGSITVDNAGISIGGATAGLVSLGEDANYHGTFTLGANAVVTLAGANATLQSGTAGGDILSNLGTINEAAGQTLTLKGNEFLNGGLVAIGGGTLVDSATALVSTGTVTLAGGTLNANGLANFGAITGSGLIETVTAGGTIANLGVITATGGALTIADAVIGGGTLAFGAGGSFVLDAPFAVGASLSNTAAGSILDLAGAAGASASIVGGSLVVTAGASSASFALTSGSAGETVGVLADGAGGSDVVFANLAAASLASTVNFGNAHVGDSVSADLSVGNIAALSAFTEALDASVGGGTGALTGSGSFAGLAAGAVDGSDLLVTVSTAAAGAIAGSVVVSFYSDGSGVDGNAPVLIGTETVVGSGAVFAYAAPTLSATSIDLGATRVGGTLAGSFSLADGSVASAYQEALDYVLSGAGTGAGSLSSGASALLGVALSTAASGYISGSAGLSLTSDGAGTSGLGTTSLSGASVSVVGTVYQAAAASFSGLSLSLGNVHVGDADTGAVSLGNTASGALVDDLLAAYSASGAFAGSGSLDIVAGANGSLSVSLATGAAGSFSGNLAVVLNSYDSALGSLALGSQTIALSGAVFAYAAPTLSASSINLGATRVGGTLAGNFSLANGSVASAYQEALDYVLSGAGTGSGSLSSGASALLGVALSTAASGYISGTALLSLISDGAGTSFLGTTSLSGAGVSVTGTVYQTAAAALSASSFNLGNVHVGASGTEALGITNSAIGALVDNLIATLSGSNGGFSGSGSLTLAAGASGSITLDYGINSAGAFTDTLVLNLSSYDSALGSYVLAPDTITLTGTATNYAALSIGATGAGTYTASGSAASLNFGTTYFGKNSEAFTITNSATGLADLLTGSISVLGSANGFVNTGTGSFAGLSAGQIFSGLGVSYTGTLSGTYTETLVISASGLFNGSSYAVGTETITVTDTVIGTYTLLSGANSINAGSGTDFITTSAANLNSGDAINGGGGTNTLVLSGGGAFNLGLPLSLLNITTVAASEGVGSNTQTLTLRTGLTTTVDVASVAGGSISIIGANDADRIYLGNGTDTVKLGSFNETVYGGSGTDTYIVTASTIKAGITAGSGTNLLSVTGGGTVKMGTNLVGNFTSVTLNGGGYSFTADTQAGLAIVAAGGSDTITVGAASQTVTGSGGASVHVDATTTTAGAKLTSLGTGGLLEITNGGTATLNAADTGLTVQLDKAAHLTLGGLGFITAIGETTGSTIIAGGANQTLSSIAGGDSLIGFTGFGDTFAGTVAGMTGDKITNFGGSDVIDLTNLASVTSHSITTHAQNTVLSLTGASGTVSITLLGSYNASDFLISSTGGSTSISYTGH